MTHVRPKRQRALALALSALGLLAVVPTVEARTQEAPAATATPAFVSSRLSVEVVGHGPDVMLIPGYASSREVWRVTADRLSATHRVHLVQLAGFAGEPWIHGDGPLLKPAVEALAAYIDQSALERPAVVGHSMGALAGLMLAQAHPDRIGKLMSVDSLPFFAAMQGPTMTADAVRPMAEATASMIASADDAGFRAGQEATAQGLARDPATRTAMVEWSMASDRQALASGIRDVMLTDARPGLARMTTPVTALYAADAVGGAPAAMADALWRREYADLRGVTLIRVDDSRHFIMADQPERFAELLDAFLAE